MTQETNASSQTPAKANQPSFGIQRVFLKGTSLELPLGSKLFLQQGQPQLNLAVQVNNEQLQDGVFEVSLRATLTSALADKTLFLVEVEQAGIFTASNMTPEQLANILEIAAPTILAPYLRAQISDTLTRATLPPFLLPEINWGAMAMERRAQTAGQAAAPKQIH